MKTPKNNKAYKALKIAITATLVIATSACTTTAEQADTSVAHSIEPVYDSQTLYFHYFSVDIPSDINQDESIIETSFWGNNFHAYPIESQKAFTELVESRIAVFSNHKISQEGLDYDRESRANITPNDADYIKDMPPLNMTTALYLAHKYNEQQYKIISNPLSNLDSTFNISMYSQWYIYLPEQHKYVMTRQSRFPARFVVEMDRIKEGKKFLDTQIRPLNQTTLSNPKTMAIGPIAWINPDRHPTIDYQLTSKEYPIQIQLETNGFIGTGHVKELQKSQKDQLEDANEGKDRHLDSGSHTVSGMKGREVCYYYPLTKYEESAYIWCSWGTDGKAEDLDNPFIYLNMYYDVDGSETSRKQAMQAWEQLLGSFKRRGRS